MYSKKVGLDLINRYFYCLSSKNKFRLAELQHYFSVAVALVWQKCCTFLRNMCTENTCKAKDFPQNEWIANVSITKNRKCHFGFSSSTEINKNKHIWVFYTFGYKNFTAMISKCFQNGTIIIIDSIFGTHLKIRQNWQSTEN